MGDRRQDEEAEKPEGILAYLRTNKYYIQKTDCMKDEMKSTYLYMGTAVIAGYLSFLVKSNTIALAIALAGLIISEFLATKILGKKDRKWLMANGGVIYIFLWFLTWVIFYNTL